MIGDFEILSPSRLKHSAILGDSSLRGSEREEEARVGDEAVGSGCQLRQHMIRPVTELPARCVKPSDLRELVKCGIPFFRFAILVATFVSSKGRHLKSFL